MMHTALCVLVAAASQSLAQVEFDPAQIIELDPEDNLRPEGLEVADLDGDGLDDVAISLSDEDLVFNEVLLLRSHADGSLSEWMRLPAPDLCTDGREIAAGDIDNDGDQDLVLAARCGEGSERSQFWVLRNRLNETGAFVGELEGEYTVPSSVFSRLSWVYYSLELVDLDGDGWIDLVGGVRVGAPRVAFNNGQGSFPSSELSDPTLNTGNGLGFAVTPIDLEGDGMVDLLGGGGWGQNLGGLLLRQTAPRVFQTVEDQLLAPQLSVQYVLADLNSDGLDDIAPYNLRFWDLRINQGDGEFAKAPHPNRNVAAAFDGPDIRHPSVAMGLYSDGFGADMDLDGDEDLVIGGYEPPNSSSGVSPGCSIIFNDGLETTLDWTGQTIHETAGPVVDMARIDLARDRVPDVLVLEGNWFLDPGGASGHLYVYRNLTEYPCPADISSPGDCAGAPDLSVDLTDFVCYLDAWANASSAADVTTAGSCLYQWGVAAGYGVDLSDFVCYLSTWASGCD